MRNYIIFFALCLIFFILPLQIFIIGNDIGIGVQGAVYRYQITGYGVSFIPLTREIGYVLNGTLVGRTAQSVLLWVMGTMLLTCTTILSGLRINDTKDYYYRQVIYGLIASFIFYLGSCIIQYGLFLHGPAGFSLPVGIMAILCWIVVLNYYNYASNKILRSK